jgi:transposase
MTEKCQGNYVHIVKINTYLINVGKDRAVKELIVVLLITRKYHVFWLDNIGNAYIINITHMDENYDAKQQALRSNGSLNPHPESVQDEQFLQDGFFDPNDLVQVKYEMLRHHREGDDSVTDVAKIFGTSRQAFYAAQNRFRSQGIPGLIPKRRGPRAAHKCTEEVMDFAEQWENAHPTEPSLRVADAIEQHFGIRIHPRTINRALDRRKKKRLSNPETDE